MEYYLAYDPITRMYLVRQEGDDGQDSVHSAYHRLDIARNTVQQLNERSRMAHTSHDKEGSAQ